MITIELYDGSIMKFNFPEGKEQEFLEIWLKHKNKAVRLKEEEIKLSDISDCYIGEKVEEVRSTSSTDGDLDMLKNFLGIFK